MAWNASIAIDKLGWSVGRIFLGTAVASHSVNTESGCSSWAGFSAIGLNDVGSFKPKNRKLESLFRPDKIGYKPAIEESSSPSGAASGSGIAGRTSK